MFAVQPKENTMKKMTVPTLAAFLTLTLGACAQDMMSKDEQMKKDEMMKK